MSAWPTGFSRHMVGRDVGAALIVVVMLVPQSLAYAQLAGMPLQAGLYASILPLVAYAVFGSSSALSVGPVAVISLMTATALTGLAPAGSADYLLLASWLALLSGVLLLLGGLLRMGFIANLMSHAVIAGFMTGAAILIVLGQLKPLLGLQGQGGTALQLARSLFEQRASLHLPTAMVGTSALLLRWLLPQIMWGLGQRLRMGTNALEVVRKLAPVLLVCGAIALTAGFDLAQRFGFAVVGSMPAGLPSLGLQLPTWAQLQALFLPALIIGMIGFVESVSVAQSLAIRRRERIEPNAELRGLGAANIAAALSGGFPVTGGLSRSIVNFSAGARTPMAGVYAAVLMSCVVSFFTGAFAQLPTAVLAATITIPVLGLIDLSVLRDAWGYARSDAWAYLGTALGVLGLGIELGILLGVGISVMTIVWQASVPHIAEIGRLPGTVHYRNTKRAQVITYPHLLALRIDADLFFANARPVERAIESALLARAGITQLLLDLSGVNQIDLTALEGLRELNHNLRARGVSLSLAEVKGPVLDRLARTTLLSELVQPPFRFTHDAFVALNAGD